MQQRLKDLGYLNDAVDGEYGPKTELAMRSFQVKNGLTVNGMGNEATYKVLFSVDAIPANGISAGGTPSETYTNLQLGSTGNAVIRLLTDAGLLQALGADARRNAATRLNIDQAAMWKRILDDQFHSLPPMVLNTAQSTMLATLRQHIALMHRSPVPAPGAMVYQTAFVPLPEKGPAKTLRKKTATFLQVLLIDGPKGVARVMKEKKARKEKTGPKAQTVTWTGRKPRPAETEEGTPVGE